MLENVEPATITLLTNNDIVHTGNGLAIGFNDAHTPVDISYHPAVLTVILPVEAVCEISIFAVA